jgi:glycosyltransferase involved in cell wall biosynthesis
VPELGRLVVVANTDWFVFNFMAPFLRRHVQAGISVVAVTPPGPHVDDLRHANVTWLGIPMSRGRGTLPEAVKVVHGLRQIHARIRPDIVLHVTTKPVLGGFLALLGNRDPGVVNVLPGLGHAFASRGILPLVDRALIRHGFRLAGARPRTVSVFHQAADRLTILGSRRARTLQTRLIPGWGVELTRFSGGPTPLEPPLVVMISRMMWTKGVREFVEAARLCRDATNARFVMVGNPDPGNPASVSSRQLAAWANDGVVEWWGHRDDVSRILVHTSVCVLPSRYAEGVPQVLIEAAAMRVPTVASDIPGCREIVMPEETGLLVPAGDVSSLAAAILRILRHPSEGQRMGDSARALVEQRFSTERLFAEYLEVYRALGLTAPAATARA